jgi:hypothetical protein
MTLCSIQKTLCSTQKTICIFSMTLWSIQKTLWIIQKTICIFLMTLWSIQKTLWIILEWRWSILAWLWIILEHRWIIFGARRINLATVSGLHAARLPYSGASHICAGRGNTKTIGLLSQKFEGMRSAARQKMEIGSEIHRWSERG